MFSFLSASRAARPFRSKGVTLGLFQQPVLAPAQRRWNWQIYLKQRPDKQTGKLKYDNWDQVIMTLKEPRLADGTSLLRRSQMRKRHIKPTTWNKYIGERKEYRRKIKRIDDLHHYIKFMNATKKK
mmetsp:Transcript_17302/g.32816  ORF Transcript_17302/g.32816 Transcript_17302/m.32816 type:complete len:126 (-) Transcript_17302:53-430(-)